MKEHRRAERITPPRPLQGRLTLYVGGQSFAVKSVRDVSPFGVGVCIESDIAQDIDVRLSYQSEGHKSEVSGTIAWSSPVEAASAADAVSLYRIGICLQPENVKDNLHFYKLISSGC